MTRISSAGLVVWCVLCFAAIPHAQDVSTSRHRIEQVEMEGRKIELASLKGAVLFVTPEAEKLKSLPLVIHFHGAPWLIRHHIAKHLPRVVLVTVQLGAGSSAYGRPFSSPEMFRRIADEARTLLNLERDWTSITLTGFSAGYGAIRAILRDESNFRRVRNVLLLDGIHASYVPEGVGPVIKADDLDSFVKFARRAVRGEKSFVITHSAIFPAAYASTTECTNFLIESVGLTRRMVSQETSAGMRLVSLVDANGFHVRAYAGSTAADHVDHLHSMPEWFRLLLASVRW